MKTDKIVTLFSFLFISCNLIAGGGEAGWGEKKYKLIYSENADLCSYASSKLNEKLKSSGSIKIDFEKGFAQFNQSAFNFPEKWGFTKSDQNHPPFPFYYFDINNDGKDEAVVLALSAGDILDYSVYILSKDYVNKESLLDRALINEKSIGSINLFRGFRLDKISDRPEKGSIEASIDEYFVIKGLQETQFFAYKENIYVVITTANEKFSRYGIKTKYSAVREFLVVGKYLGGFLGSSGSQDQNSVIESICYLELN